MKSITKYLVMGFLLLLPGLIVWATDVKIQIKAPQGMQELAAYTEHRIQATLPEIKAVFAHDGNLTIQFILVNNPAEFKRYVGYALPDYVKGVTLFPSGKVILKTPTLAKTDLWEFRTTLIHELVHSVQGQIVGLNMTPTWFTEGLALYISDNYNLKNHIRVSKALFRDQLIPMAELTHFLNLPPSQASLAYAESASIVAYLIDVYGLSVIHDIFNHMKAGRGFEQSVTMATNIDYADFPAYWRKYIHQKYRWIFMLDIQNIIWLIIPVMVIVIYVIIRIKNRRKERDWQANEATEDYAVHDELGL